MASEVASDDMHWRHGLRVASERALLPALRRVDRLPESVGYGLRADVRRTLDDRLRREILRRLRDAGGRGLSVGELHAIPELCAAKVEVSLQAVAFVSCGLAEPVQGLDVPEPRYRAALPEAGVEAAVLTATEDWDRAA